MTELDCWHSVATSITTRSLRSANGRPDRIAVAAQGCTASGQAFATAQRGLVHIPKRTGVPFENNHAERVIRPAVIICKNNQSNRSDRGADTQAILMSIDRTLKQRGHPPIDTVIQSIEQQLETGHMPPLPPRAAAFG